MRWHPSLATVFIVWTLRLYRMTWITCIYNSQKIKNEPQTIMRHFIHDISAFDSIRVKREFLYHNRIRSLKQIVVIITKYSHYQRIQSLSENTVIIREYGHYYRMM